MVEDDIAHVACQIAVHVGLHLAGRDVGQIERRPLRRAVPRKNVNRAVSVVVEAA